MISESSSPSPFWRGGRGVRFFLAAVLLLSNIALSAQTATQNLTANWQFRQVGTQVWYPATVPGTVHTDLQANGLIDEPFADNNEKKLQWIERKNWEYRTYFDVKDVFRYKKEQELVFEGLDTYAEVYLNNQKILTTNNMFRSWRVLVKGRLIARKNELRIVFTSPILKNDSLAKNSLRLPAGSDTNQFPVGPFTRKAAYHFGWDFAPRFVTCGIWKSIRLESWRIFTLRDIYYKTLSISAEEAVVQAIITTQSDRDLTLGFSVNGELFQADFPEGIHQKTVELHIKNPKLWWPNGSGEAHLHTLKAAFFYQTDTLAKNEQRIGLRTVELVNEPDAIGTNFYFKVNGKPIFMQGANYVPQDVFLPRVQDSQYVHLLTLARDAGMNMLRVWGGGVYEKDIFYDLCDEYGILVWQDFMFAGGLYPAEKAFLENVEAEVAEQIIRLRKHPCLALWCGNNEIEVAWKNWGWQQQFGYSTADSLQFWNNYTDLFHRRIPALVDSLNPQSAYVSTSPQSNWGTPENFSHGSMHYWGVWHGQDDFSGYQKNIGRFMVEWGFQSYPDYDLLAKYISPEFLALNSEVMKNRQKSYVGNGKITDFLQQYNFDFTDFKTFAQQSQNLQALGYEMALKSHIAAQPHCMGTLLWQLNDCWPGPSWSIINYNGKPKPAYWRVKEVLTDLD